MVAGDRLADGVDAFAVVRLEEARLHAERLGEVAGTAGQRVELVDRDAERVLVDRRRVGLDPRPGEDMRVPRRVDGGDVSARRLERLRDPGGAGEQVERRARTRSSEQLGQHRHEPPLRPDVLDHTDIMTGCRMQLR